MLRERAQMALSTIPEGAITERVAPPATRPGPLVKMAPKVDANVATRAFKD